MSCSFKLTQVFPDHHREKFNQPGRPYKLGLKSKRKNIFCTSFWVTSQLSAIHPGPWFTFVARPIKFAWAGDTANRESQNRFAAPIRTKCHVLNLYCISSIYLLIFLKNSFKFSQSPQIILKHKWKSKVLNVLLLGLARRRTLVLFVRLQFQLS